MTLSKNTELGQITVSDQIFADMLIDAAKSVECEGKVWPSTKRGKVIPENGRSDVWMRATDQADGRIRTGRTSSG